MVVDHCDFILQPQLALFEASDLHLIAAAADVQRINRRVEVTVLDEQIVQLRLQFTRFHHHPRVATASGRKALMHSITATCQRSVEKL